MTEQHKFYRTVIKMYDNQAERVGKAVLNNMTYTSKDNVMLTSKIWLTNLIIYNGYSKIWWLGLTGTKSSTQKYDRHIQTQNKADLKNMTDQPMRSSPHKYDPYFHRQQNNDLKNMSDQFNYIERLI